MQQYNPREAAKKNNPEQKIITAARNVEYDRKFKKSAEDKLDQDNPTPQGDFKVQTQAIARQIVEGANALVNKKKKGDISNADFAADMAMVDQMVDNLGNFAKNTESALAAYNDGLLNGSLSYGMDQHDEATLRAIDKGEVKLALDKEGRVKMEGKAVHPFKGNFDVNIYDFINIPKVVNKIPPINLLLDPHIEGLGIDENGMPKYRIDENGQPVYDTGAFEDHRADILKFTQETLSALGPDGVRSYLADHMNLPQNEVKRLVENINYTDEIGDSWNNEAESEANMSIIDYMGNRYQRKKRPHPDTIALNAANEAANIASGKGVNLPSQPGFDAQKAQPNIQAQETEVMETPQGVVAETSIEDVTNIPVPRKSVDLTPVQQPVEEVISDQTVETTPIKMKALSAADLIKKYS